MAKPTELIPSYVVDRIRRCPPADCCVLPGSTPVVAFGEEIVSLLASDPNATVRVAVEISADFPDGASDSMRRAVSENARSLGIKKADWE